MSEDRPKMDPNWKVIAIVAAIFLLSFVGLALTLSNDSDVVTPTAPASVLVDGPDKNEEPDTRLVLNETAQEVFEDVADSPESFDVSGGLRGGDSGPVAEHTGPLASPNFPGCTTRILPTNWSNRTASVKAVGLHYTAGGNIPGLSDMNGLTGFASRASAGVSWHFLIDAEGNCYYSVPLSKKAWTIGNLNSQTVNIEVIGRGNEPSYPAAPAGAKKLSQVVNRLGRIFNIPMQVGAVSNCVVTKKGIITHFQGGQCSGGHVDIKPYDFAKVVSAIATGSPKCNKTCERRKRLVTTRKEIKRRNCAPIDKTKSDRCLLLQRRVAALRKAGVK